MLMIQGRLTLTPGLCGMWSEACHVLLLLSPLSLGIAAPFSLLFVPCMASGGCLAHRSKTVLVEIE